MSDAMNLHVTPPITAIVINRYRLTESSLIVLWCSAEEGLFKTVAKGALRPKSAFAGRLDLFITCELVMNRSHTSDLHQLKEAHVVRPRLGVRGSYRRVLAATYFGKLVEMSVEKGTPLGGVHELLAMALDFLEEHEPTEELLRRFENRLCLELGFGGPKHGGADLLREVLHQPLPEQREQLREEWRKMENQRKEKQ